MAYPIEYCATHGIWCAVTGCIGLDVVPTAPKYYQQYGMTEAAIQWRNHNGVDTSASGRAGYPGTLVPIYAIEDGIVIETSKDDGTRNGVYLWGATAGNACAIQVDAVKTKEVVFAQEHFATLLVAKGQRVKRGQQIGVQGSSGDSTGAHCHTKILVNRKYIDPYPYIIGEPSTLRRLIKDYADPQEVLEMFDIPPTLYKYTDTPANIRVNPGTSGLLTGKKVATGAQITITALAAADGYIWGRIPDGWVAIAQGKTAWAVPASQYPDLSGKVTALETAITAANAKVSTLTTERDRARSAINAAISTLEAGK